MPVVGRSIAGTVAVAFAQPLCRMIGLTHDAAVARRVGAAVAATDYGGVVHVLASATAARQRRAALINAAADVGLAGLLVTLALRRHGSQRLVALAASGSVWFGAGAWVAGARRT
jgi:hypothetical protein